MSISACMLLFQMELLSCGQYIHEIDRLMDLWPVEATALILTHSKAAYPQRHKHRYTNRPVIKIKYLKNEHYIRGPQAMVIILVGVK